MGGSADVPARVRNGSDALARWGWLLLVAVFVGVFARTVEYGFVHDDYVLARPWTLGEVVGALHGSFDQVDYNAPYFRPASAISDREPPSPPGRAPRSRRDRGRRGALRRPVPGRVIGVAHHQKFALTTTGGIDAPVTFEATA